MILPGRQLQVGLTSRLLIAGGLTMAVACGGVADGGAGGAGGDDTGPKDTGDVCSVDPRCEELCERPTVERFQALNCTDGDVQVCKDRCALKLLSGETLCSECQVSGAFFPGEDSCLPVFGMADCSDRCTGNPLSRPGTQTDSCAWAGETPAVCETLCETSSSERFQSLGCSDEDVALCKRRCAARVGDVSSICVRCLMQGATFPARTSCKSLFSDQSCSAQCGTAPSDGGGVRPQPIGR